MKRLLMIIPLVFLCCLALSCQQGEKTAAVDIEADIQAIKDVVAVWNDVVNTVDIDRIVPIYADDAIEIHPDDFTLAGKEAIEAGLLKQINFISDFVCRKKPYLPLYKIRFHGGT